MANIKSAAKRARQAIVRRDRNQQTKKSVRTIERKLRTAVSAKDKDLANELLKTYSSEMGKAAQKGKYHPKTAARKISRIALFMNKVLGQ
ncbi:MAG: 30S ribosomal protein S20 [Bdellovibrionales bacterium]|nr:30S ribosomal protein S20 [Bdellovibrionales bacterium]